MDWDTRALHREACDAFTTASTVAETGKNLLREITEISDCLKRMVDLQEARVCSCNDSTWKPPINTDQVMAFVRITLEKRRDGLREQFNKIR